MIEQDVRYVEELQVFEKDFVENLMIVDLFCNDLSVNVCVGSVRVEKFFVLEFYCNVYYLVSYICVELVEGVFFIKVFMDVFFGGFIIGVLKIWVMEIIDELEFYW